MAKKHVISYFLEQEQEYLEMLDDISEIEELYKSGKMDYERYAELRDQLLPEIEELKKPYEMMCYVMFLLNIPNKPKKGKKYEQQNKMYFAYLDKFSKEKMIDEQKDVLKNFKKKVKEFMEKKDDSK